MPLIGDQRRHANSVSAARNALDEYIGLRCCLDP
jgi:hypothetical protein